MSLRPSTVYGILSNSGTGGQFHSFCGLVQNVLPNDSGQRDCERTSVSWYFSERIFPPFAGSMVIVALPLRNTNGSSSALAVSTAQARNAIVSSRFISYMIIDN